MPSASASSPRDGDGGDGQVGIGLGMLLDDGPEIHAIQLIAAEDQEIVEIVVQEMDQVFADGIGGALIPGGVGEGLLRGEDFDEAAGEMVELIGLRNMAVERGGVELGQQINASQAGIDAIGDGNVDQAVFAGERHGGFGAFLGEGKQARCPARRP